MESLSWVFVCILPALTELVIGIQRGAQSGLVALSSLAGFCATKNIWSELFGYNIGGARVSMWRYGPDSLWLHLIDRRKSSSVEVIWVESRRWRNPALYGIWSSWWISHPQLPDGFLWRLRLFQSSVHFKATLQGQAFHGLVAMQASLFEIPVQELLTLTDGWDGWYGWLRDGLLFAFIIPTMFSFLGN